MKTIDGMMGFIFLLVCIVIMLLYIFYICGEFFCYSPEGETDKELDFIFAKKFYEESGRPIKNEITI